MNKPLAFNRHFYLARTVAPFSTSVPPLGERSKCRPFRPLARLNRRLWKLQLLIAHSLRQSDHAFLAKNRKLDKQFQHLVDSLLAEAYDLYERINRITRSTPFVTSFPDFYRHLVKQNTVFRLEFFPRQ